MSQITSDDLINRFDESHSEIVSEDQVHANLNFALRNVLQYIMPFYRENEAEGLSLAARMLAFHIHKLEAVDFDEWKV